MICSCGSGSDNGETKPPTTGTDNPPGRFDLSEEQINKSIFCPANPANTNTPPNNSYRLDDTVLAELLSGSGLRGWIHGATHASGQYVFTYRNPDNFFQAEEFNLTTTRPDLLAALKELNRHDEVTVLGSVLTNTGPIRHLAINDLTTITPYADAHDYSYTVDETIFDQLDSVTLLAKVHAIVAQGKALALEYEDIILPVFVEDQHLDMASTLFRNDKIVAELSMTRSPGRPLHFRTSSQATTAIRVVDAMANCHSRERILTGKLVKFSKSPQITRDVYAVSVVDENNISRIFTFFPDFNSADAPSFDAISEKAEAIWLNNTATIKKGRNYLVNPDIEVEVAGTMNIVSRSQANPQVYIKDIGNLTFTSP